MKPILAFLWLSLLLLSGSPALAWDATGHRLSAYVAWDLMTPASRASATRLLQEHPRYVQDFLGQMPDFIRDSDSAEQQRWLFGQAAVWPDLARGFSASAQQRYHRPDWHWIDGRWVRGSAERQGNVYVNTTPLPVIHGPATANIRQESQADNVVTALEYSLHRLEDGAIPASDRAVALAWMLHLLGDLHQPLHTGALVSGERFPEGDRGGNAINVRGAGNLHSVWDRALRHLPFMNTLDELSEQARQIRLEDRSLAETEIETWLEESRQLLHSHVYTTGLRSAVAAAEGDRGRLPALALDEEYEQAMEQVSRERIALSGLRIAAALNRMNL